MGLHGRATPGGVAARGAGARGWGSSPARGAQRGGRGASNGNSPRVGATSVAARGGKRKAGADFESGSSKRRTTDSWGSQPIAQQPLKREVKSEVKSEAYGAISYDGNDAEWYQDSYGQNWG